MNYASPQSAAPQAEFISISVEDAIATITLCRSEVRNAINDQMRAELIEAFEWADASADVRAVILTGEGRGFCSGGDVSGMKERLSAPPGEIGFNGWRRQKRTHRSIAVVHGMTTPEIAAVNGAAVGLGLDLALACDFIIAVPGAKMSMSFIKRGLVSDGGGLYFLPRRVGLVRAKELILSGRVIEAEEGQAIGLIDRIASAEELLGAAHAWALELSHGSPAAIALTKAILDRSFESSEEQVFALGREAQAICYSTTEHRASVEAFLQKSQG